jgi:hypothetical protein
MSKHPLATVLFTLGAFAVTLSGAVPSFWRVGSQAEFLKGEVDHLSIDSHGRLLLGPSSTPLHEPTVPFVWTVVSGSDGALYAGTGNDGHVVRVDASGEDRVFFDADELEIHAIATAPGGGLFVGSSPNGRIYKVEASGQSTVFFDPPDTYIWSLAVDQAGTLFAATGDKGVVYKITSDGTGTVFYSTTSTHVMSLAFDQNGYLLASTASPGRVLRLDDTGKPFVILESPFDEVRSLTLASDGLIYAVAVAGRPGLGTLSQPVTVTPSTPVAAGGSVAVTAVTVSTDIGAGFTSADAAVSSGSAGPPAGGVYRINQGGDWDLIWESRENVPYDVLPQADRSILIATGNKGKIFRLSGDPFESTLLVRANAQQVTAMFTDASGTAGYATSNPGRLLRLSDTRAASGFYKSDIRDARTTASWGMVKWQATTPGGSSIAIATRTGNTRVPDDTWSTWSSPYASAQGSPIVSPRAQYLQWKATFAAGDGASPVLTSVTAAYVQRNLRPRVTSITVHPPGTVFQQPFPAGDPDIAGFDAEPPDRRILAETAPNRSGASPAIGKRVYERGLMTFSWKGKDSNGDDMRYAVLYRREGETNWRLLRDEIREEILVWDTTSVPNGTYVLRITASDAPSNPITATLTGHLDSSVFDIDNTPPVVRITGTRQDGVQTAIQIEVRDDMSTIDTVEYSVDGTRWEPIYPKDGIADSPLEEYELMLASDAVRGAMIRATDALNNVGGASTEDGPHF